MHGVRGHVHGARGGGCCCSLEKKRKSAKACFQIRALPRSLQLMSKSLEADVHISAGEEDKNFDKRQTLDQQERKEMRSTFNNIYLLPVYNVKLKVKPTGHVHTASLSCGITLCGSLNDIGSVQYRKCKGLNQITFYELSIFERHRHYSDMSFYV